MIDADLDGNDLSTDCPEAIITRVVRPLAGAVRTELVDVPGRAGAWAFDEEPGETILTVDVTILVDDMDDRRDAIAKVRRWARTPDGRSKLTFDDEPDRYWSVKVSTAPPLEDDEYVGKTTLSFTAEPYAWAHDITTEAEAASGGSPDSGSFAVTDELPAEPEVRIKPTNGTITSFTLGVNGESVAWQTLAPGVPHTVSSGQTITVASLSDTVLLGSSGDVNLTGAFDPDDVSMVAVAVTGFPLLVPGSNSWSLSWTGTATAVDVTFVWRERFI